MRSAVAILVAMLASVLVFWTAALSIGGGAALPTVLQLSALNTAISALCCLPYLPALRRVRHFWQRILLGVGYVAMATLLIVYLFRESGDPFLPTTLVGWLEMLPWVAAFMAGASAAALVIRWSHYGSRRAV